ncbi:MAG: hypothetical protein ACOCXJ_09810 [Planctomycetota bacterium]
MRTTTLLLLVLTIWTPARLGAAADLQRWHPYAELDAAVALAERYGRPLLFVLHDPDATEHMHNDRIAGWQRDRRLFGAFVRVFVPVAQHRSCPLYRQIAEAGPDLGPFIPTLRFGTVDGRSLGGVRTKADRDETEAAVRAALEVFGGVLRARDAERFWREIDTARAAVAAAERDQAADALGDALELIEASPQHPFRAAVAELVATVDAWAREELAQAQTIADAVDRRRRLKELRRDHEQLPVAAAIDAAIDATR